MSSATAVILGRPNVGKSSLFNRLTGTRRALVGDEAGLTRDLRRGALLERNEVTLVDTGGLVDVGGRSVDGGQGIEGDSALLQAIVKRVWDLAMQSDLLLLLTDASVGPTGFDEELVSSLRRINRPILLVANKVDLGFEGTLAANYAALGLGEPIAISVRTGRGLAQLRRQLDEHLPGSLPRPLPASDAVAEPEDVPATRILLCGRPNAGKSTLLNRLCGEDKALVSDIPGTTRDEVETPFARGGSEYLLTDTAGVQRRWRQASKGHILAAARSLDSLKGGTAVLLLVDVGEGLTEQDVRLLGGSLQVGCAAVLVFSKTDLLSPHELRQVMRRAERRLNFATFVPVCSISSHSGRGIGNMLQLLDKAVAGAEKELPTSQVNRVLETLIERHPPPLTRGRRASLRYAHVSSDHHRRRVIRIHGSGLDGLPDSYRRYLEGGFRKMLDLGPAPVQVEFRPAENPYARPSSTTSRRHRKRS